ncbi:MAG TPA: aminotransferase class III-fold pyridoxal phosphate-dependent enzyme [Phycisphaerae bacterium]
MSASTLVDTYAQFPIELVEGYGSRVRDANGRDYWDFYGGHAVALLGQAHPAVTQAIGEQAARLTFYSNVVPLDVRTRAAQRLCRFTPAGLDHVFFCNSGTEANEAALKLAIQQTGRKRIAALKGAFHGRTLLSVAATDSAKLHASLEGLLVDTARLRPNAIDDVELINQAVAAVIVEPIQSIAGIVELEESFLAALRRRCDQMGALLIYDEIQTGMGRLGRPFAAGAYGVLPDMITLAKGIANGIPMGAVVMNDRVAAPIKIGDLGSTFGGGPVACAGLLAVIETIEAERLVEHAAHLGERMRDTLKIGPVRQILGRGCLIGLVVEGAAKDVQKHLLERGFITGTSDNPQLLRLMPPINTPLEAVDELGRALKA